MEPKDVDSMEGQMPSEDISNYRIVRQGQLAVNTMWLNYTGLGVSNYEGYISPAYMSYKITDSNLYPRFVHHLMRSPLYVQKYSSLLYGVRPNSLQVKSYDFEKIEIIVPPIETQQKIIEFLDEKTAKIGEIIEKKQKHIELLKEQRAAIITKVVTKGLDPNRKMIDSGIEWIGDIPNGWRVERLKYLLTLLDEKARRDTENKISLENIEGWTGRYIESINSYDSLGTFFNKDDILFGKLRPYLGKVMLARNEGEALGDILVYRPVDSKLNANFGFYAFISYSFIDAINSHTYGVKMPRANPLTIGSLPFVFPSSLDEQKTIVKEIENRIKNTNELLERISNQIEKLKEYRSALIYNTVTGKLEV